MRGIARNFSALFCVIFLFSCSTIKPPSWYGSINKDSSVLVGFGSGKNLQSAKSNALNDIISQISVDISSNLTISQQRHNENLNTNVSNNIALSTDSINLVDISYDKSEFSNGVYYVKAKISKKSLIKQLQTSFNDEYNALTKQNLNQCPALSIKEYVLLKQSIENLDKYSLFLSSLGVNVKDYSKLKNIYGKNSPLPQANIKFFGHSNEIIESALLKDLGEFYAFNSQASNSLNITISGSLVNKQMKITADLRILDCRGNVVFATSAEHIDKRLDLDSALRFAASRVSVQLYKHIKEWIE